MRPLKLRLALLIVTSPGGRDAQVVAHARPAARRADHRARGQEGLDVAGAIASCSTSLEAGMTSSRVPGATRRTAPSALTKTAAAAGQVFQPAVGAGAEEGLMHVDAATCDSGTTLAGWCGQATSGSSAARSTV